MRSYGGEYKVYFEPSSGRKFYSKPQVLHHISGTQSKPPKPKWSLVKVEKVIAEGLPPGWIKEIKVQSKGSKIRKDVFYTDPVSGYVFRSMKDALRFVKTGLPGRLAILPKQKASSNVELADNASKQEKQIIPGESSLTDKASDGHVVESTYGNEMWWNLPMESLSQHTFDKHVEGTEPNTISLDAQQVVKESDSVELGPQKAELECDKEKPKRKKEHNLTTQASKRLAGVILDSTEEQKCQAQLDPERLAGFKTGPTPEPEAQIQVCSVESETYVKSEKVLPESSISNNPSMDMATAVENTITTENKNEEKQKSSLSLPFGDSLQDPCIEFAIKTLTGDLAFQTGFCSSTLESSQKPTTVLQSGNRKLS